MFVLIALVLSIGTLVVFVVTWLAADANTRFAVLGISATALTAVYVNRQTKRREIEARFFEHKRDAYKSFIDLLFTMTGKGKKPADLQLERRMLQFKKDLLLWASPQMIELWNKVESSKPDEGILNLERILREIRKELGQDDSGSQPGDLVATIIKGDERDAVREKLRQIERKERA